MLQQLFRQNLGYTNFLSASGGPGTSPKTLVLALGSLKWCGFGVWSKMPLYFFFFPGEALYYKYVKVSFCTCAYIHTCHTCAAYTTCMQQTAIYIGFFYQTLIYAPMLHRFSSLLLHAQRNILLPQFKCP